MKKRSEFQRQAIAAAVLLTAFPVSSSAIAAGDDAGDVLRKMAPKTPAAHAFIEVRQSRLLRHPSVSSGTLEYLGPGHLVKAVQAPVEQRFEIDGNTARLTERAGRSRTFELGNVPELQAIFAGISGILGGDEVAIRKVFTLALEAAGNHWTLRMTPLDAKVLRRISALEVRGNAAGAQCIGVREASGVSSTMVLVERGAPMPRTNVTAWVEARCTGTP